MYNLTNFDFLYEFTITLSLYTIRWNLVHFMNLRHEVVAVGGKMYDYQEEPSMRGAKIAITVKYIDFIK